MLSGSFLYVLVWERLSALRCTAWITSSRVERGFSNTLLDNDADLRCPRPTPAAHACLALSNSPTKGCFVTFLRRAAVWSAVLLG